MQQLPIAEDNDHEGKQQAEDKQADDVGDVVGRLGGPVHRAGGARTFRAVAAPAKQGWHGPPEGVQPGEGHANRHLAVVSGVGLGGAQHGAVALVRQYRQGYQGHNA